MPRRATLLVAITGCGLVGAIVLAALARSGEPVHYPPGTVLKGAAAFGDWTRDEPGVGRRIMPSDLPDPAVSESVDNGPNTVPRPESAWPKAPPGFVVERIAKGLDNPRRMTTAPNGDLFVAESDPGRIKIVREASGPDKAQVTVFATGLDQPFGIAFFPPGPDPLFVYVGNTGSVVRFPYRNGDLAARAGPEMVVADIPSGGRLRGGGHWTRDVVFSNDGATMFVSVGSRSNVDDDRVSEARRADILAYAPDGSAFRVFASGIRNPVGLAVDPATRVLWTSVNERDELGDNLPPDYITHVREGGFYGWPWYFLGPHPDPRHRGKHPELRDQVIVPDVLVQAHSASLSLAFYGGTQFPAEYRGDIFAAEHGSWNRRKRTGYKVIRVRMSGGKPTGEYQDFVTGFVLSDRDVWGRPVGVAVDRDGSLVFTDDGSCSVWRVAYAPGKTRAHSP